MKGRAANLLLAAAAALAALLAAEIATRFLWKAAPAEASARDSLPIRQVADPGIIYRLVPGSAGFYGGTQVRVNALGLRGPEIPPRPASGTERLLLLGDSMVFGVGLEEGATFATRLGEALSAAARPVEAINAGVFGYNLAQEISLLRDIGPALAPSAVVACFVHNDIENWGLGQGGAVPEIKSGRFDPPPADAWSSRLAGAMLPGTFDAERLNLLPGGEAAGLRAWLAARSRLYLFTYLRLRTHSWNLTQGERRDPLVDARTCQSERLVWGPIRQGYRRMREISRAEGAAFGAVILGGLLWEGAPLERLHRILAEEQIPFLDLTPVWFSPESYAAEYSLGWDPHPNAGAVRLASALTAGFVRGAGLLGGGEGRHPDQSPFWNLSSHPGLDGRLRAWRARQREKTSQDDQRWAALIAEISATIVPGGREDSQVLHGFWEPGGGLPGAAGGPGAGRWLSASGSLLFPGAGAGSALDLELAEPADRSASERLPRTIRVRLSAPPDRCDLWEESFDLPPSSADGTIRLQVPIPPAFDTARLLEAELAVDRPVTAAYLSGREATGAARDHRLLSAFVRRASLVKGSGPRVSE